MSTFYTYGLAAQHLLQGEIDILTDTLKCLLLSSTASIDQDTNEVISDVSASEVTGTNYNTGGTTVSSVTIDYTAGTNVTKVDCDDITWNTATITDAKGAVIYIDGAQPTNSYLIGYTDFGSAKSSDGGDFTLQIDTDGLFTLTND